MKMSPTCLRRLRDAGYASGTTNRVLILIRFIYNLGRKWGVPGCGKNPATGLKTVPDVCRERFLTNQEAQRLLSALDADENRVAACAIKLLLLTGGRRNEITQAKWEYVNWEHRTLLVPIAKSGKARLIRLNSAALELLRSVPRLQNNPYIFPSPVTGRPSTSLHFPWTRIRKRSGSHRCPAARFATLICELSRQQRGVALCGAGTVGAQPGAHDATLCPSGQ